MLMDFRTSRTRSSVLSSRRAPARRGSAGTTYTLSSSASAPACSIRRAHLSQPPEAMPLRLAMIGMLDVLVGRQCELVELRVVAGGFPVAAVGARIEIAIEHVALGLDLLLEQGV